MAFDELDHQVLLRTHLVGKRRKPLGEREESLVGGRTSLLGIRERALEVIEAFRGLFEQGLNIGRNRLVAFG